MRKIFRGLIFSVLSLPLILPWARIVLAEEPSPILSEPSGGFKYVIPKGWIIFEIPGFKYKACHGAPTRDFAPNIVVLDEAFNGSLEDYVKAGLTLMEKSIENFKLLEQNTFTTDSGLKGIRIVSECRQMKNDLLQTQYFFQGTKSTMLVVVCSVLAEDGAYFSDIFDSTIKTFEVG